MLSQNQENQLYFREDFKESPTSFSITQEHLTYPELLLHRHGPTADSLKKSYHDYFPNDPYYVRSGLCITFRWAISFEKQHHTVDLTDGQIRMKVK